MPNPLTYRLTAAFQRQYDKYPSATQMLIEETLTQIREYLQTSQAPFGLRIKHLGRNLYEARINIRLRIVFFRGENIVKFICAGDHEDVILCLKHLKDLLKG